MACDMCKGSGKAAAEVFDDSFACRSCGDAMAEITADGDGIWIETPIRNEHGARYNIMLAADFCPWYGARLQDRTEWETAGGEA